jgi:electron transport complex protein RnfG
MAKRDGNWILTLMLVALIVAAAAFLVTSSYELTKSRIAANQRARLIASLNSVLDPALREHDLATVQLSVLDPELLGSREPVDVFVAIEAGQPVAAVFASVAPDGYNAAIRLLIGVTPAATLTGVRAVAHRETPGLGDAIDAAKSDWIEQFAGASLAMPPAVSWAVDKDDGAFDSITGATVTSRAVVGAVKNTLLYFEQHRVQLFQDAVNLSLANDADPE